ncbi:MAG: hypothetical protein MUF54_18815 [Polyangiaceae bacterium]|nr:hypothetical protein [Polyangiaceae bacterium]
MFSFRNVFIICLTLAPWLAACGSDSASAGPGGSAGSATGNDPAERTPIGKGDAIGSCQGRCGGKSSGNCWCDDKCADYRDCCSDVSVCHSDAGVTGAGGAVCKENYEYAFSDSDYGWKAIFTDYPATWDNAVMQMKVEYKQRPSYIEGGMAHFISSRNKSDDVFMGYKKKVKGLEPNTLYKVKFDIELLSMYEYGGMGIGGSPGNSVYVKAGASSSEPVAVVKDGDYRLNIDKSNGRSGGADMSVLGDISKPPDGNSKYVVIERSSQTPMTAKSDAQGNAWLIFGTDSGYEGTTALYYTKFSAHFERNEPCTP